ncbi:MAG: hypothetical protein Q9208_001948 [Pyrenodesmia sp. 3 TL-2023]
MPRSKRVSTSHVPAGSKQHTHCKRGREDEEDQKNETPKPKTNKPSKIPNPSIAGACRTDRPIHWSPHRSHLVLLPPEILDMICKELDEEDIPAVRVQCRYLCGVATPHHLRSVNLRLKKTSIESLLQVSKHPILSHNVQTLCYNPNLVEDLPRKTWEKEFWMREAHDLPSLPATPEQTASERQWRSYRRAIRKSLDSDRKRKSYLHETVDAAWSVYQKYLREQDDLIERDYASQNFHEAIQGFPNLTGVHVNYDCGFWRGDATTRLYADVFWYAAPDPRHREAPGVPHMLSLLSMLSKADLKLLSLRIGDLNWRFFACCSGDTEGAMFFENIKRIMPSLHDIQLCITTWTNTGEYEDESLEPQKCREFLENGALGDLLAEAPNLRKLAIAFDANEGLCPIDFEYLALGTHWPRLRTVKLESIDAHENDWMAFFERHATTIKHISIASVRLLEGKWVDVLERMQRLLTLEEACFYSTLLGDDPGQMWFLDRTGYTSSQYDSVPKTKIQWALQKFMLHGGVCPLRDEETHPQASFDYYGT